MPLLIARAVWRRAREWRKRELEQVRRQRLKLKSEAVDLLVEEAAKEEEARLEDSWLALACLTRRDRPSKLRPPI